MAMKNEITLDRREVVAQILKQRGDTLLVTGLGNTCWDAAAVGDDARNFYVWGAMGGATMIGLGLALAQPTRRVLVITGDGEMLMGLGSLATVAVQQPRNLSVVVIDNERYGETGMQDTHTRSGVDLAGIAKAAGFAHSTRVDTEKALQTLVPTLYSNNGPTFAAVKVMARSYPTVLPARDGTYLKNRFRDALLGKAATE
jgi:thiamine pyrophosphate-dependent acetolactate synthase large subunit-like protein